MIHTSKLTEKLLIQTLTVSATTYGESIEVWKTVKVIYGSITTQRGSLKTGVDKQSYADGISFYTRYIQLDKKGTRILYNDEPYKIVNNTIVGRAEATVLDCISFT